MPNQFTTHRSTQTPKHIGIDARLAGLQHGGIGRYIENLIQELLKQKSNGVHWHFFFHDKEQANQILPKKVTTHHSSLITVHSVPFRHYTFSEQLQLPTVFNDANLDLLHVPHFNIPYFYSGKIVVTIHDLLWHEYTGSQVTTLPAWQYWLKHMAYKWLTGQAVHKAVKIFVPAETIKHTVLKYYPTVESKIVVTKEGVSKTFVKKNAKHKTQNLKRLLYIGSLYPHKNITVVLDALRLLPEYKLLLVGSRDVFADQTLLEVKKRQLESQVEFLGFQPDEELTTLLSDANALVQPSLSEGFGLTGLESLAVGTPVLCSDIPIFHEIYQDAGCYFDPNKAESLVKNLRQIETKKILDQKLSVAKKLVEQYSWEKMAKETWECYREILA